MIQHNKYEHTVMKSVDSKRKDSRRCRTTFPTDVKLVLQFITSGNDAERRYVYLQDSKEVNLLVGAGLLLCVKRKRVERQQTE